MRIVWMVSLAVFLCTLTFAAVPVITGVQSAGEFGALTMFASGSWLEIAGTGLSPVTREWRLSDFSGNFAPMQLEGVQVMINGRNAFIRYISDTQINVQAPDDVATGSVAVVVQNVNGLSAPFMVTKLDLAPGLLAPARWNVGGKQYAVATFPDGTFVCQPGLISGIACRAARPGDVVTLYGIGFGPVPNAPAGVIAQGLNMLGNPFTLRFGSAFANVQYAGAAPGSIGLYQFNVVVPGVSGDQQIIATVAGAPVGLGPFLTVSQ